MSRKSWHLSRRTFLRGAGVAVTMPYLHGMEQAVKDSVKLGSIAPPRRLAYVYFPNGASSPPMDNAAGMEWSWLPVGTGADYRFNNVSKPLEKHRENVSFLGGLSHPRSRELLGHLAGDTWLTAGDLRGDRYLNNESVDQVAARSLKKHTRIPSLVLSTDGGVGYKSRLSTLSFDATGRPIPSEHRQRAIFERYFSEGAGTSAERRESLARGRKIVDLVLEDSKRLRRQLGGEDQEKMDEYLSSLNRVEEQVRRNEAWLDVPLKPFSAENIQLDPNPRTVPKDYLRATFDLMVLAFQTDLTRVASYMMAREDGMGFGDSFPKIALGMKKGHHTISHEKNWKEWGTFDRWYMEQFTYFIDRLKEVTDEHGSVLDRTLVMYGSCCSTTHNARNLPLALVGGKDMGVQHGRYERYGEEVPMSNLLLSTLHAAGIRDESFSDSTGPIPGLVS